MKAVDFLDSPSDAGPGSAELFLGESPSSAIDVVKKGLSTVKDYGLAIAAGAGEGIANTEAGIGTFIQAPAANTLSGVLGARALADRGVTAAANWVAPGSAKPNEGYQESAQLASQFAAEERAKNADSNIVARLGLGMQSDGRERVKAIQDFNLAIDPELVRQQGAMAQTEGFLGALEGIKDNPMAFTHMLARSAPDMVAGAGIAKGAAAGLAAAGKSAATQVAGASAAGIVSEAASSANQTREGVYQQVAGMPLEQLAAAPRFNEILAKTGDAAKAREILANELADQAPLLAGAGTMAGSMITNKLFGGDATAKMIAGTQRTTGKEVFKNIGQESVEEGLQGVPEDLAQHGAVAQADPSKQFDIGKTLAENMAAGAAMGGGGSVAAYARDNLVNRSPGDQSPPQLPDTGPLSRSANIALATQAAQPIEIAEQPSPAEAAIQPKGMDDLALINEIAADESRVQSRLAELNDPAGGYGPAFDTERAGLVERSKALAEERDTLTAHWPKPKVGSATTFSTESGARIDANYALVNASELNTSHDERLKKNPSYPAELQPRERDRAASEMQISGIAQRLDPARLGESADAATGAPIIGADGLVESGNARSIALKRVYQSEPEKADAYRKYLVDNAQRFGLDPRAIADMPAPVLVRIRKTPVDRAEFARQANASTVAQMSPSEQARSDASRIDVMDDLRPDDNGDFATSRDFIRRFVGKLPATEQSGMLDANGQLSQAGYARVRNAVLAKAYGESPVLVRMVESMDDSQRNIGKALVQAAPEVAKMRQDIKDGALHKADITVDLLAAVDEINRLKEGGRSVADALAQGSMFGAQYSPEQRSIMAFLDANQRKPRKVAEFIQSYIDGLRAAGNPGQASLLGGSQVPAKMHLLDAATNAEKQEWVRFPANSGTLGIPRADMPQIKGEHRGALIAYLKGKGIDYVTEDVPASDLKPTQAEFSVKKAEKWGEVRDGADRSVLVSSDGYILDGHHQWVAALASGETVKAIHFKAPIRELLAETHQFPSAQRGEGATTDEGRQKAREDFAEAMAELGSILRDFAMVSRMVPEKTPDLIPTLVKLFEAGIREVGYNIKDLIAYVKKTMKGDATLKKVWNKIGEDIYRKAARQAVDNALANPQQWAGQGDLFNQPETPVQADMFAGLPPVTPKAPKQNLMVIDGVEYDLDAPNFGMPKPPITLMDGDPLLEETYKKSAESTVEFQGETVTRSEMRQAIEDSYFSTAEPAPASRKPIAYVMGGGGASGKGFVKNHLIKTGRINETGAVSLDPDEVKPDIPEYTEIVAAGDSRAAAVTHEESSDIAKRIKARAIAGRYDIVLDVTLGDPKKGEKYLQELKDAGYEVRLFGVTVNPEMAVVRAMNRAQKTGRYVPINALLHAHKGFNGAFEAYAKIADEAVLFDNTTERQEIAHATGGKLVVSNQEAYNGVAERSQINERARTLREISSGSVEENQRDELGRTVGSPEEDGRPAERVVEQGQSESEGTRDAGSSVRGSGLGNEGRDTQGREASSPDQEGRLNEQHSSTGAQRTQGQESGAVPGTANAGRVERLPGREDGRDSGRNRQPDHGNRQVAGADGNNQSARQGSDAQGGGKPGKRGSAVRNAGIPAGREIPAKSGRNFAFGSSDLNYDGSWLAKARQNVEALELFKQLEKDGRQATREEQAILAKFIGWGASDIANSIFGDKLDKQLAALRSYEEAIAAFDRAGKDALYRGGRVNGYFKSGDSGYYAAFNALNAKAGGSLTYYDPTLETITRAQVEATKPDAAVKKWAELRDRIKSAMTKEEWDTASRSTQYAHYTSKPVVQSMMRALERMGFKGGTILEPGAGIGVFPGLMPVDMATNSAYTGVEFDHITGGILKQLFPDERILVESFIDTALPDNYYDIGFGNPPFGNIPILADPKYRKQGFALHDYFFAKTMDSVKPGGLVVFVTSRYTMDKLDDKARAYLAERADLVGAIRLPQTAFKKNAGTDVVTDVLFLRKKVDGETFAQAQPWAKSAPMKVGSKSFPVNEYFHAHPEMVLGDHSDKGKMANSPEPQYTVEARPGDIEAAFDKAATTLPENVFVAGRENGAEAAQVRHFDWNPKAQKEGNYYIADDGKLMIRERGYGVAPELDAKQEPIVRDFIGLRDALKQAHYDQLNDGDWGKSLAALQKSYRAFVKAHGRLHQFTTYQQRVKVDELNEDGEPTGEKIWGVEDRRRFPVLSALRDDPDWTLVAALESFNQDSGEISESQFLSERVLDKPKATTAETPTDAMLQTLNDIGHIDIGMIADRLGIAEREAIESLGALIYDDPSAGWQTADEYLSGDVRKKLKQAEAAAKTDKRYQRNVEALISVMPAPRTHTEIIPQIGMPWIPAEMYEQFLAEKAQISTTVTFNERTGQWHVAIDDSSYKKSFADRKSKRKGELSMAATQDWGTDRRNAAEILEYALTGAPVRIMSKQDLGGGKSKDVFDQVATEAAIAKVNQLRETFKGWLWEDQARIDKLVPAYNDKFNTMAPRKFDGGHMTLVGASTHWQRKAFPHVKRGAWRIVQQGNTYLAHAVGSGKTAQMVISAMEQKRLGLIKKPMFVVPNHMLAQFSSEWLDLYPAARLMVADEQNFTGDNRRRFVSRVAMSDLDGVIITQSAFKLLDLDPEFKSRMIEQELDYLRAALVEAGGEAGEKGKSRDPKVKQIENRIERLEQKLEAAMSGTGKDKNVRFDETGVDMLYVDEAHLYRKLSFVTQRQVKGIDSNGSDQSFDLWMKAQWLRENKNPKRNLVMASGTPVTNTMAELYTVQKFMDPDVLEERGLSEFDQWASMFGAESTAIEPDASGKYGPVTRFNKFVNVSELTQMFRDFADVLTSDYLASLLGDKRPKVKDGARKVSITPKTADYADFQKNELQMRMDRSRNWKPSRDEPNNPDPIIAIIGDGRLAAIDMRFIDPSLPNDPDSKLNRMIDEIIRVHKESASLQYTDKNGKTEPNKGAAQIVFSDLGFGAGVAASRGFNARAWFEKRLRDAGVPPAQVAFMSDHKKSSDKLKLFAAVNSGKVRIVVGSSKNMGTGVNAQQRLIALHHLDAPWYPADLEQREGRIIRQGNKNPEVQIYAYASKGSYDEQMWSTLARKQFFIDQALSGDPNIREIEDLGEASQFDIAAAMVADDPRVLQLAGLRAEVEKLSRLYMAHEDSIGRLRRDYATANSQLAWAERSLKQAEMLAAKVQDISGDNFVAKAEGKQFTVRKEWGQQLMASFKERFDFFKDGDEVIGQVSGFDVVFVGTGGQNGKPYMADVALRIGDDDLVLAQDANTDPVGVALRAGSMLTSVVRQPANLRQTIEDNRSKMNALEPRLNAPFPLYQMLLDKEAEARKLEDDIVGSGKDDGLAREQALEDAWAARTGAITPLFSRGNGGEGMALRDLQAVVDRVSKSLKNLPKVHVLESPASLSTKDPVQKSLRDFIRKAGAWHDAEGATHEGEIYLFASGLADEARAEHVLAVHEVTHYGLRGVMGKSLDAALQEVWGANAKVRKAATALKERNGLSSNIDATEEVLADMPSDELTKLIGWRRVVKVVRDWLSRAGFERLAARFDAWMKAGMTEQEKADVMVADLVNSARDWVRSGKGKPYMEGTRLADGSLADDLAKQEKWLLREAKARGYQSIDEMAEKNYKAFENLAKLWRKKNPVDGALLSRNSNGQFELVDTKTGKVVGGPYSSLQRARAWRERRDQEYGAIRYKIREIETGRTRLSRNSQTANQTTATQRAEEIISKPAVAWKPIDTVLRTLSTTVRLDRLTSAVYDRAAQLIDRYTPEEVKAGVVSDYGIPEAVIDQRTMMQGRMRVQLRKTGELVDKLATLTRAESRVAYEWMNNASPDAAAHFEAQLPPESVKIMEEVKTMIDKLSQEAVALGQLDHEAFKRNRFEYLRRSYIKHTVELTKAETASRKRAIAILGEQYKGRGMSEAIDMAKFKNVAPEWWGRKLKDGQADKALKGEKFIRLERRAPVGEGVMELAPAAGPGETNPQKKGRLMEVAYWPAGEALPAKYSTWEQAGTWEVRDTKGGKLIVWRDFTKQERLAMGEIDEARYAIAKSLHGMIHDVETGRYLEWLGRTYGKKPGDAIDGELVDASERMRDVFKPGEFVQVPDTKIPGTSVLKYGKLAGRIIPGPVWNDVRQTVGFRFKPLGETYAAILGAWKTAKTALSPAVHTNNVMANFVMADWHDVGAGHILKALRIILGASQRDGKGMIGRTGNALSRAGIVDVEAAREILTRYGDSGANLGSWVTSELQREQIEPLLAALEKELGIAGQSISGEIGVMVALQKALQLRFPSAWEAFKPTLPGRVITTEAKSLIDLYEAEDQVFRLAAWLKAKEDGAGDLVAGKVARRSFLDYNINAPWVQAVRNTALPFISFTYRAVPMLLETAARRPHKLIKLGLIAGALNALGYMLSGGDEDDERKLLPEEKAGSIFGMVPKLIRMPWNDANGQPVFLDVRRFVPVGDIFDTGQTHSAFPMLPALVPGGPLAVLAEIFPFNKVNFTGKPITLETDTGIEKAEKVADHLYKAFAPNIAVLPGTYAWTGIANAAKGRTDSFGQEQSTPMAVSSAFGVKLGSYPKDVLIQNTRLEKDAKIREIDRNIGQINREYQKKGIDGEEQQKLIDAQIVKKLGIIDEFQKKMSGGK